MPINCVKALSLRAQYDSDQILCYLETYVDEKWCRQSDELPIIVIWTYKYNFLAAISTDITAHYPKAILEKLFDNESEVQ
jgi:hypothetical protein